MLTFRLKPGQTREAATDALHAMQPQIRMTTSWTGSAGTGGRYLGSRRT
jgi:hypothetical protein